MKAVAEKGTRTTFHQAAMLHCDPARARAELDAAFSFQEDDAVVLFGSSDYDLTALQKAIKGGVQAPLLCCTILESIRTQHMRMPVV